jgi:hypothetical protein
MKNWMFFGSVEAGTNNAILFTLLANCNAQGLDPVSWPHEFGHGMAKSSYGAWERESVISSWMIHQEETGIDREIGKPKRRAEHATKRSVVECEDRSVGFPISARQRVHAA